MSPFGKLSWKRESDSLTSTRKLGENVCVKSWLAMTWRERVRQVLAGHEFLAHAVDVAVFGGRRKSTGVAELRAVLEGKQAVHARLVAGVVVHSPDGLVVPVLIGYVGDVIVQQCPRIRIWLREQVQDIRADGTDPVCRHGVVRKGRT